jgi:prepilin-type processing-associated H-X9-DG protein
MYNHVLGPNAPSCFNGTSVQTGIYSAAVAHRAGVNVLFGDGRVNFIAQSIDRTVWRDLGSRVDQDLASGMR